MYRNTDVNPCNHPTTVINLNSVDNVKLFEKIVSQQDFEVDAASLTTYHIIDAKSIMGMYSLDLSKDILIIAHTSDEEARAFFAELEEFVVNA